MRTTIRIDDEVYRRVKQVADRSDRTIGQVIEDAIQLAFRPTRNGDSVADLPVYGGSGVMPGVDLTSNRSVAEAMDKDVSLDEMR
jgi:isocitrate dehydrogenase